MACPFFSPREQVEHLALPHPARLPLGAAWHGECTVPGQESTKLAAHELESCNLGYALRCPRLPKERHADAVRFAISKQSSDRVVLQVVLEAKHLPVAHGRLEYDCTQQRWKEPHPAQAIQRLAECFLQSYLQRRAG